MMYDNVIMRTIIDLPDEQIRSLRLLCQRDGISRAEAIRRALAGMLASQKPGSRAAAFGAWSGKKKDGKKVVRALRAEWDA